jgi:hypothetical protein
MGELEISVMPAPAAEGKPVEKSGGYIEHRIRIQNRSSRKDYTVRLSQSSDFQSSPGTYLQRNSRTVQVPKGTTVTASLFQPLIEVSEKTLSVEINGVLQEERIPLQAPFSTSYGYSSAPKVVTAVLCGRAVPQDYKDQLKASFPDTVGLCRSELPVSEWSPNWLGYTAYDVVLLTDQEARSLPEDVQLGLQRYVESGGVLHIIGQDTIDGLSRSIPAGMRAASHKTLDGTVSLGFGEIRLQELPLDISTVFELWNGAPKRIEFPDQSVRLQNETRIPVRGLSILMILFAIAIGPVNIWLLSRKGRKMWLWWNVPLISVLTCLTVFTYSLLAEGVQGHGKMTALTLLDENTHRGTTLGYASFYSPLSASDGLHFSYDTDVFLLDENDDSNDPYRYRRHRRDGRATRIDWTKDQHFTTGWILPRTPANFALRKNEPRRERMIFRKGDDGSVTAVNGLGIDIETLCYTDPEGVVYSGTHLMAGQEMVLERLGRAPAADLSLRKIYAEDWPKGINQIRNNPRSTLGRGSYLAITRGSPFLENPFPSARDEGSSGIVLGICAKGNDNGH